MIQLLIVDDEVILRDSLKFVLERNNDIIVAGTAGNGYEALEFCKTQIPDLILLDVRMPVCDGVEGTRLIKEMFPQIRIIMLTTFLDEEYVLKALKYGAEGYLLKDIKPEELTKVIRNSVNALGTFHINALKVIADQIDQKKDWKESVQESYHLSEREIQIIHHIVNGKSNREIASSLFLTEGSIKNSVTVLLNKLKLNDRTQLAVFAVRKNII